MLPREMAGIGGDQRAPLNWAPTTGGSQRLQESLMPGSDDHQGFNDADDNWDVYPDGEQSPAMETEEDPGPVSAAPPSTGAKKVPHISANPTFWQADNPAGFDDPAWRQTMPFSTFEDAMDAGGTNDPG